MFISAALLICARLLSAGRERARELNREITARNEELKLRDSMKSDLLAAVAHEINSPLAVIAASGSDILDLLNETPPNADEIRENLNIIEKKIRLIDHILIDLTDTAAIETGRLSLLRVPVSLAELINEICDAQYGNRRAGDKRVARELEPGLPSVPADPFRIEQVILNLMSNAFRYSASGVVTVRLERAGGGQTVSVTDDGGGVDYGTVQNPLERYSTTDALYWRHGIGLYICRQIVAAHGGDIGIKSEKGRGTTVAFTISETEERGSAILTEN